MCQFLPSSLDRLFVQACDLREQAISTGTDAVGLHRDIPATLLFIQSAQQQIHLPMEFLIWMNGFLWAMGALAWMNL